MRTSYWFIVSKLLGVHFHQHLNWDEQVQATCKSCYGTIQIVRKLKNFAGYRLRKHLVESLVLSKLVLCMYGNDINDIVKIGWLPVRQRRDFHVHKALHFPSWLSYVPLATVKHVRSLRPGAARWRGAPFKTLPPSYLMLFRQILDTVAISKYTVGK